MTLIELIEKRRIALIPEWDGGWHAEVYDEEDTIQYSGYGCDINEAILDALDSEEDE